MDRCLQSLPTKLYEFYERTLLNIPPPLTIVIRRVLSWLVVARRALKLKELEEILSITENTSTLKNRVPIYMNRVLGACGSLLRHNTRNDVISISHFTVKVSYPWVDRWCFSVVLRVPFFFFRSILFLWSYNIRSLLSLLPLPKQRR